MPRVIGFLISRILEQDFGRGLKRLSRNRVFTWKCIGYIFIMNGIGGQMMNMPKYIETQYRVSAAKASFLTGQFIHDESSNQTETSISAHIQHSMRRSRNG